MVSFPGSLYISPASIGSQRTAPTEVSIQAAAVRSEPRADSTSNSQFMLILLAQLRNQNPLEPLDDTAMISQIAQLNSLEQLQQINAALQQLVTLEEDNGVAVASATIAPDSIEGADPI